MAGQEQINPSSRSEDQIEEADAAIPSTPAAQDHAATQGVDDLLDEIDGVLEKNAEEFVKGFVQKGGQ
ncbi:ubiquitin-like protein Pup [Arthrobacter sp. NPDC090010]|uniref:ubiquitin-like protein Pup n=1 Tax=Arthrobacter sp. NPDC090010 TaxID=3363942 RepID=UPI0037FEB21C